MSAMDLLFIIIGGVVVGLIGILVLHWYAGREIRKSEERIRANKLAHEEAMAAAEQRIAGYRVDRRWNRGQP